MQLRAWITLLTLGLCSACSSLGTRAPVVPVPNQELVQAEQLNAHLQALQLLVQGGAAEQAETLNTAKLAYESARQGAPLLRYGLLLAAPGHPARDPTLAQQLLREALSRPELLLLAERALGLIELQRVDAELKLSAENKRLVTEAQKERERQRLAANNAISAKRLQQEMEENARLRKELELAQAKLDAIANIERTITDRPPTTEGRTP